LGNVDAFIGEFELPNVVYEPEINISRSHVPLSNSASFLRRRRVRFDEIGIFNGLVDFGEFGARVVSSLLQPGLSGPVGSLSNEPEAGDDGPNDHTDENELVAFFLGDLFIESSPGNAFRGNGHERLAIRA
jgi:hypothetical protein